MLASVDNKIDGITSSLFIMSLCSLPFLWVIPSVCCSCKYVLYFVLSNLPSSIPTASIINYVAVAAAIVMGVQTTLVAMAGDFSLRRLASSLPSFRFAFICLSVQVKKGIRNG